MENNGKLLVLQIGKIIIGLWVALGAWVFDYASTIGAVVSNLFIGILLVLMGGANILRIRHKRPLIGASAPKI